MPKPSLLPLALVLGCTLGCTAPGRGPDTAGDAGARLILDARTQRVTVADPSPTVSAVWDRAFQEAVARKGPGPTVTARAAAILHGALYDTWAAYHPTAAGSVVGRAFARPPGERTARNRRVAMSHAAHMVLLAMFPEEERLFDDTLRGLAIEREVPSPVGDSPVGVGRRIAFRVAGAFRGDRSNWSDDFENPTGYAPVNPSPLALTCMDCWTPENAPIDPEIADPDQDFATPQWARLRPRVMDRADSLRPAAPEPFLTEDRQGRVDLDAGTLTLDDGRTMAITPDLVGPVINPAFVAQAEAVVAASAGLTDEHKLIAEFWEDNTDTSFPPGTWLSFTQYVSARDDHTLDRDAVVFFAVATALHEAGIATWEAKVHYDYARPVRVVRALGRLGLIGREGRDALTGERGRVIRAWAGPGAGTREILATRFLSYQTPGDAPSPPFAEYPSGHSGFSAAAAEVLARLTGSDRFGASIRFAPGSSRFEPGITPAAAVTLSWPTFTAAAREAGRSRILGGIHFADADRRGRALGRRVGAMVVERVTALRGGTPVR